MIGAVLFSLVPAEPAFEIGEPLWLRIRAENSGPGSVRGTVYTGVEERTSGLFVHVTDARGGSAGDPWRFGLQAWANEESTSVEVEPGATGELRVDLAKYAWLDVPGTYRVRLLVPFGRTRSDPPAEDDPRWVETDIVLVPPENPPGLVRMIPDTEDWASWDPRMDRNTYDAFGHALYVPLLEARPGDRPVRALASCPCTEATEALFRLYDGARNPDRLALLRDELLMRMPRPERDVTWFVAQSWNERFDREALRRARESLAGSSQEPGWGEAYQWGARVVASVGEEGDAALLSEAMERTLVGDEAYADGANGRSYVVQTLEWALRHRPGPTVDASGDAKLVQEMQPWDGRTGEPPPGWEAVVMPALLSENPAIVAEAIRKLPWPASRSLVDAIVPHIGSQDGLVSGYLHRYLVRHPPGDMMRVPLFAELATAEPWRVEPLLTELRTYMPLPDWINLTLVKVSADPSNKELVDLLNFGLDTKACKERGHNQKDATDVAVLVAAWMGALRTQDLSAGPIAIEPGVTDPALVRVSYHCKLAATGETWPAR